MAPAPISGVLAPEEPIDTEAPPEGPTDTEAPPEGPTDTEALPERAGLNQVNLTQVNTDGERPDPYPGSADKSWAQPRPELEAATGCWSGRHR